MEVPLLLSPEFKKYSRLLHLILPLIWTSYSILTFPYYIQMISVYNSFFCWNLTCISKKIVHWSFGAIFSRKKVLRRKLPKEQEILSQKKFKEGNTDGLGEIESDEDAKESEVTPQNDAVLSGCLRYTSAEMWSSNYFEGRDEVQ